MALRIRNNEFAQDEGAVRYLNGSGLSRPLHMPLHFWGIAGVFIIVAAIIGGIFLYNVRDELVNAPIREAEATEANLSRQVDLGLPLIKDLVQLDDATIFSIFETAGYTIYNLNGEEAVEGGGMDVIKLPADVTLIEAGIMYSQGVSNLSSSEAALLLNGSWRLTVGRGGYLDMKVKYADFSSGSVEAAVQNAMAAEGLAESQLGESGVDSAGNTYQAGQVDVNGALYNWQISACPLSEVYSVDGLPATAAYVGVRIYL